MKKHNLTSIVAGTLCTLASLVAFSNAAYAGNNHKTNKNVDTQKNVESVFECTTEDGESIRYETIRHKPLFSRSHIDEKMIVTDQYGARIIFFDEWLSDHVDVSIQANPKGETYTLHDYALKACNPIHGLNRTTLPGIYAGYKGKYIEAYMNIERQLKYLQSKFGIN